MIPPLASPVFRRTRASDTPVRYLNNGPQEQSRDRVQFSARKPKASLSHTHAYADRAHAGQTQKGSTEAYIVHLEDTMGLVERFCPPQFYDRGLRKLVIEGPSEEFPKGITRNDVRKAALLHDVVEKHGLEIVPELERKFGETVTRLVLYCSTPEDETLPYNEKKRAVLQAAVSGPMAVVLLTGADKLSNLRKSVREYDEQGEAFWRQFKRSKEEKLQYYRDVVSTLRASGKCPALVEDIAATFNQLLLAMETRND